MKQKYRNSSGNIVISRVREANVLTSLRKMHDFDTTRAGNANISSVFNASMRFRPKYLWHTCLHTRSRTHICGDLCLLVCAVRRCSLCLSHMHTHKHGHTCIHTRACTHTRSVQCALWRGCASFPMICGVFENDCTSNGMSHVCTQSLGLNCLVITVLYTFLFHSSLVRGSGLVLVSFLWASNCHM